tara:strand:+ start:78 stop:341 length:264 start_codon:yes stop_codon:yes gene_type:complete
MELNKDIRDILIEFAMIVQEEKYTNSQVLIRSTYDTFRIQNIVEKLSIHDVVVSETELCDNPHCEDGVVDRDMYGHPIYCQVCDKHN